MAPTVTKSRKPQNGRNSSNSNNRKRVTTGTNNLIGGKTPSFRPNDSNSSSDEINHQEVQEVVKKSSSSSHKKTVATVPKKKKATPPPPPPPVIATTVSLGSSSSSSASSSSSSASTSSSESVATSVEESDGGWSSPHNDFSSNHDDDDEDVNMILVPPPVQTKKKVPGVKKKNISSDAATSKPKAQREKKKTAQHKSEKNVETKKPEMTMISNEDENDEHGIIDDSIIRAGSDHSMDHHSFTEATTHQAYIVVEEPLHLSYDFDGVHLEEDISEDQSMSEGNIPSSVAINIDTNGNQQQQMSNGGTNPLFDVSDPSMDDSVSKNYDSRYDGSLQDLTYNHGNHNSKGSINHFSGGSWNPNNDTRNSNSQHKGDDDDSSDSSSEMDEIKGYLSAGELRNPNILLQPYVGERPPTPPSPMRSMKGRNAMKQQQKEFKTSSPIKSITTKVIIPNTALPRVMEPYNDDTEEQYKQRYITNSDLVGIIDLKEESVESESAPSSYRNKQFDDFYPTEYSTNGNNDEDIDNVSNDNLLDVSIQPSCKYNNDEEEGARETTGHSGDNRQSTTMDNDKEKKQQRTIRILIVVLTCALLALLAMGVGVVVLIMNKDEKAEMSSSAQQQTFAPAIAASTKYPTQSPGVIVSSPTPIKSGTTAPTKTPSTNTYIPGIPNTSVPPIFQATSSAPIQPQPVAPTNAPILRNSTASLTNTVFPVTAPIVIQPSAPTNAPIQRNSSASLTFTAVPIAAPVAVIAPSPVVETATDSPTTTSIALPPF